jgi:high mobility group protein B2
MPIALEQPKKPVGGAYGIFLSENRAEYVKACAGKPMSEVSKMASEAWKKISDAKKAPFQKKYEDAKVKFDKDMAAFLAAGGEKVKGAAALRSEKRKAKEGKKKKDPNAPKKPAGGAYGVFLAENRAAIIKTLPAGHKITDVSKAAGAQWNALSDAAKKPFQDKYLKKMEEFKAAMEEYKSKNADAEEDEEEDEEDEEEEEEEEEEPPAKKSRRAGA